MRLKTVTSPPPLRIPTSPNPFHSLRAQWETLQHYLHTLPLVSTSHPTANFLSSISHPLLLLALEKKTSEVHLLQHEATARPVTRPCSLDFPNYAIATPPARNNPPSPQPPPVTATPGRIPNFRFDTRPSGLAINVPDPKERSSTHFSLSPLSPTFGPRKGHVPAGTVARPRSLPLNSSASCGADAERADGGCEVSGNFDRRMQWEAAWMWIESHLEEYVGRVGEERRWMGMGMGMTEEEIWGELVRLREIGEGLARK